MDNNPPSPEAKPPYEFWAFISYSRKDKVVAKKLHEFIETYGVPVEFVEHPITTIGEAAPARLHPCFRDIDDLPSGPNLPKALRDKLAASRFLVVVCSPNSAASEWVDKEIIEFRSLHGEGAESRIHSFIVAGRPNRNSTDCCFPPSLRDQNPCAPNATPLGEGDRIARLKLIAAMIGVSPDAIIQRDQERRMKQMSLVVAASLVLMSVLCGFWWRASVARDAEELARNNEQAALKETQYQVEHRRLGEGRIWKEQAKTALNSGDHVDALMLAGRAVGYQCYGRRDQEPQPFSDMFPLLLASPMQHSTSESERAVESADVARFIDSVQPTYLPIWAGAMKSEVTCVTFSPDGNLFATGADDDTVAIRDAASGSELATLPGNLGFVTSLAFSPDSTRILSTSSRGSINLWEIATSKRIASFVGSHAAFSPDGSRLATDSKDYKIKVWDTATAKELTTLPGHTGYVSSVAFSPDGRIASSSSDYSVVIWGQTGKRLISVERQLEVISNLTFSPDGNILAGVSIKDIKLWDSRSGNELATLQGHDDNVSSIAFTPDGRRLVSSSFDNSLKIWDVLSHEILASFRHPFWVNSVAPSGDGIRLALCCEEKSAIWDIAEGKELIAMRGHDGNVKCAAFSPDGTRLASGSDDTTIKIWDAVTGTNLTTWSGHKDAVLSVAFSSDGKLLASGSWDKAVKLWDAKTGKELNTFLGHTDIVDHIVFDPTGNRFATCSSGSAQGDGDNTVRLWDANTGKNVFTFEGHNDPIWSIVFNSDGSRLASASRDHTIRLWDTKTGGHPPPLVGHDNEVWSIAFSPDDKCLASGSADQTIKIWDVSNQQEIISLIGHTDPILNVAFSPDGSRLASRSSDGITKVWDIAVGKELALDASSLVNAKIWLAGREHRLSPDRSHIVTAVDDQLNIVPSNPLLDLTAPLRAGLITLRGRTVEFPKVGGSTPMLHVRQDTLAQLADPKLTPERRAELRMELCTKSSQFRAATALWQRLLQGEWPGFEGATVPKEQAPATIPADSPIRRLYLLALIDATKHPQIHGHPTICQTALQIAPVLTKEMMATPTISLAMMSLMQSLAKDGSPDMSAPYEALMKLLKGTEGRKGMATPEWLDVLQESTSKR